MQIVTGNLKNALDKLCIRDIKNDSIPISGLLNIEANSNGILLRVSDTIFNQEVSVDCKEGDYTPDNFSISVDRAMFKDLMSKLNYYKTTFTVVNNNLVINSDKSKYVLPIILDDNNDNISINLPDVKDNTIFDELFEESIDGDELDNIFNYVKPFLANENDKFYSGYYFNNKGIYGTNGATISCYDLIEEDKRPPIFIPSRYMDCIKIINNTFNMVYYKNNIEGVIYLSIIDGSNRIILVIDDELVARYPITDIEAAIQQNIITTVQFERVHLSSAIDRLEVFTNYFTKNILKMLFNKNNLKLENIEQSGEEEVAYVENCSIDSTFEKSTNIDLLKRFVKAMKERVISIDVSDSFLRYEDGVVHIYVGYKDEE